MSGMFSSSKSKEEDAYKVLEGKPSDHFLINIYRRDAESKEEKLIERG